jgi:hypothetical protein
MRDCEIRMAESGELGSWNYSGRVAIEFWHNTGSARARTVARCSHYGNIVI